MTELRRKSFVLPYSSLPTVPVPVAITLIEPVRRPCARRGAGPGLDLEFHEPLRGEADHLTQEVGVGGLLQQLLEVHGFIGHRWVLGLGQGCGDQTLPKTRDDYRRG